MDKEINIDISGVTAAPWTNIEITSAPPEPKTYSEHLAEACAKRDPLQKAIMYAQEGVQDANRKFAENERTIESLQWLVKNEDIGNL